MSEGNWKPSFEEFLKHRDWVERLARSMLKDHFAAEDFTQEALLVAWRNPPARPDHLRAWLGQVLKRQIYKDNAKRERRQSKEAKVMSARLEVASDERPDQSVLKMDAEYKIIQKVLELREPYRTVLIKHFREEVPVHELARERPCSESTIRSQISRGVKLLQEKITRENHDWRTLCLLAVGLPAWTDAKPTVASQGSSIAPALPWGIGMLGVGLLGGLLWFLSSQQTRVSATEEQKAGAATVQQESQPAAISLEAQIHSDESKAGENGFVREDLESDSQPGPEQEKTVRRIPIKILTESGKPFQKQYALRSKKPKMIPVSVFITAQPLAHQLPVTDRYYAFEKGPNWKYEIASLSEREAPADVHGWLLTPVEFPAYVHLFMGGALRDSTFMESQPEEIAFSINLEQYLMQESDLYLKVVDGRSLRSIHDQVDVSLAARTTVVPPALIEEDRFVYTGLPQGQYYLSIVPISRENTAFQKYETVITLFAAEKRDLGQIRLYPARTAAGIVVDEKGNPLEEVRIDVWDDSQSIALRPTTSFHRAAETNEEGRFNLQGLGSGPLTLSFRGSRPLALHAERISSLNTEITDLRITLAKGHPVSLHPTWPATEALFVRVYSTEDPQASVWADWIYGQRPAERIYLQEGSYVVHALDAISQTRWQRILQVDGPQQLKLE